MAGFGEPPADSLKRNRIAGDTHQFSRNGGGLYRIFDYANLGEKGLRKTKDHWRFSDRFPEQT